LDIIPHKSGLNAVDLSYRIRVRINGDTWSQPTSATVIQDKFPPVEIHNIASSPPFRINFDADLYNTDNGLLVPYKTMVGSDQIFEETSFPATFTNVLVQTSGAPRVAWTTFDVIYKINKQPHGS
jgi:hypothetical protein